MPPVFTPLQGWNYLGDSSSAPAGTRNPDLGIPALSDGELESLLNAQHSQMPELYQEVGKLGIDVGDISANPGPYLDAVNRIRSGSPNASVVPKKRERTSIWQVPALIEDAFEDGLAESKIGQIGNLAATGKITREEALRRAAEVRSQMHDPHSTEKYGWGLKQVLATSRIVGQLLPSLSKGAKLGAATGLAVAPMGLAGGPMSPLTVPGMATLGMTVGTATGVFQNIAAEAAGHFYLDMAEQSYEKYPNLDIPGEYLTEKEYTDLRTEKRYSPAGGYVPEEASIPEGLLKGSSIVIGGVVASLELAQVSLAGTLLKRSKVLQRFGEQAVAKLIANKQLARFATLKASQAVSIGTQEAGIEALQEIATYTAAQIASEVNALANDANIPLSEQRPFLEGIVDNAASAFSHSVVPMVLLSGVPAAVGGTAQYAAGRAEARSESVRRLRTGDGTTAGYFNQSTGEDVLISDIEIEDTEVLDRDRVIAATVIEEGSRAGVRMQPVPVSVRPDGTMFATDPTAAGVLGVLGDSGVKGVRVVKRDVSRGPADQIPPWEMFSSEPIQTQIAEQFPDDSVAEVQAKMMPLHLAAMRDNVSVPEWVDQHFQDGMLFRQPEVPLAPEARLALPEPVAPAAPTIDESLFEKLRLPDAAFPPMAELETVVEPQAPDDPVVEGEQAILPELEAMPEGPEVTVEPTAPPSPVVEAGAIPALEEVPRPEAAQIAIEPRPAQAPVVEQRRRWRRRAFAMGRVIDELEFGGQAGIWKTPSGWLEDSGLSGVVTVQEIVAHLGTDALAPADAFGHALRETMAQELLPPKEMVPPLSEAPEPTLEPGLPALPEVTALQLREPGVAEFAPRAPEATREPPIPLETLDEAAEEALAAEQSRRMREAELGPGAVPPEGPVMSSKTYLANVEADAIEAADAFLAKAAKNVSMDRYEDTAGGLRTPLEHAALLTPDIEQERIRLETEARQQKLASQRDLTRQMKREQRDAALAREIEGKL